MSEDEPRIVTSLEWARLCATSLLFAQAIVLWNHNHLFALAFVIGSLAIGFSQVRILTTELNSAGVTQIGWCGRVQLRWDEITTVARKARFVTVAGNEGSVVVALESFYDTDATLRFLSAHLPTHLRLDF